MNIYLSVLFLLILLSSFEYFSKNKKYFVMAIFFLVVFAGMRQDVGYDYNSYHNFYNDINSFSDVFNGKIDAEPGYVFFNFLFKYLGFPFSTFVLFFSIVSLLLLGICLYNVFPFPSLVLVYYYCRFFLVRDMGQIRSSLVSIIFLMTLPAIKNRDTKKVLLLTLIGAFFHTVAIFIPIAYLFTIVVKKIGIPVVLVYVCIATLIGTIFFFPELFSWIVPARYLGYFAGKYSTGKWLLNPIFIMQLGILLLSLIVVKNKNVSFSSDLAIVQKVYLLSTLLLLVFGPLATIGGRVSTIFASTEILLVPILFDHFFKNKIFSLIAYFAFCLCVFYLIFVFSGAVNLYVPYKTTLF
ncbi:EpsG family protein [Enterococcus sp. 669A]|uniref:EpsG family protein n=1 Tax=Candidatus Enterococcus moelleringii TaxID=2815325 RepID=A0ABS3LF13_9ENTE|nr:EpsG family protein [Enterococcus sp. 669A]MBO1308226.1 EpsG family protein [Enterococcus sp. 669A]